MFTLFLNDKQNNVTEFRGFLNVKDTHFKFYLTCKFFGGGGGYREYRIEGGGGG